MNTYASDLVKAIFKLLFSVKRNKNYILTGIPRSGTSMLSSILCEPGNSFCFNEIYYDTIRLPIFFARMKYRLVRGMAVPSKIDSHGNLAQDTMQPGVSIGCKHYPIKGKDLRIGSNVNIPYLNEIENLLVYKLKIIGLVRNPIYTIGSWNSDKASVIPEANVNGENVNSRWITFKFTSEEKIDRQAEIWNHYASQLSNLSKRIMLLRYEDLVNETVRCFEKITNYLQINNIENIPELKNYNRKERYPEIDKITAAVDKYCKIKGKFGY
ncbi:MAG: sulfotransferase [Bacteroidetes bacterium]|nr:sulfotransferase [Bacteroidota bacterium]